MVLLALSGCASEAEVPLEASAWTWSDTLPDGEPLTTAELEAAAAEVVATLIETSPRDPPEAHRTLTAHMDETCPETEQNGPQLATAGDCTTADGWSWYGVGVYSIFENQQVLLKDIDSFHREWQYSHGNNRVIGPDGQTTNLLGMSWYRDWDDEGTRAITVELWGQFWTDDPQLDDPWFTTAIGSELDVDLRVEGGGVTGTWTGGFSRLDGSVWAFTFDLAVDSGTCVEPTGTIQLQDTAGDWYTLTWDGSTTCDGCGTASSDLGDLGTVCADFSPLTEWEDDPWSG